MRRVCSTYLLHSLPMCVCVCVCVCVIENDSKRSEDAIESVSDDEDELVGDAGEWAGINRWVAPIYLALT